MTVQRVDFVGGRWVLLVSEDMTNWREHRTLTTEEAIALLIEERIALYGSGMGARSPAVGEDVAGSPGEG